MRSALLLSLAMIVAVAACERTKPDSAQVAASTPGATPAATKITKIVFVGKEHACDCTRKSVDAGWAALQKALGTPAKLPVEQLQIDTEGDKVAPYRSQQAIMALPAIYFVDGKSAVVELLQGEVTEAQIAAVLNR
jgi:hypothetical protein